jgi:preprotein translocase subunit YajC
MSTLEVFVSVLCAVQTPEGQPVSSSMAITAPAVQTAPATQAAPPSGQPVAAPLAQAAPPADGMVTVQTQPEKKSGGGCGGGDPMFSFLLLGVMFVVFYLFLIRPQQKRQKEMQSLLNALTKGDRVITSGGMLGTIVAITDQVVTLEVGDKTRIKVLRSHVQGKQAGLPGDAPEGKKSNDKESKESDS